MSDRPGVGAADVVHDRLLAALGALTNPRILDAGCGVGGTIFFLQARLGGQYDGLTLSAVQQARARREAGRRGVAATCRFHVRNYDRPLGDLVPGGADAIVAIESLAHADDPHRTIAHLARALRAGGRLAIVDDVPADALPPDDPDLLAFCDGWSCPSIARASTITASCRAADLAIEHDEDLTPLVPRRAPEVLERLVRTNRRWRRVFGRTAAAGVIDALHGGLMLERLYARGLVSYRFLTARKH